MLNIAHNQYGTNEKEFFNVNETLKEFKGIVLAQKIIVYINNKKLAQDALCLNNNKATCEFLVEEFGIETVHMIGIEILVLILLVD